MGNAAMGKPAVMLPKKRLEWPDVAKGISILGVVLFHATQRVPGNEETIFPIINQLLTPLRMPLFFLISGYFSLKVLDMTLGKLATRRLWFFVVPYVVWATVGLVLYHLGKEGDVSPLLEYVSLNVLLGSNGQWFLHALVLFIMVLWLTRRMPPWSIILVAASPMLLVPFFSDVEVVARTVMYLPVFLIGAHCRPLVTRLAESASQFKIMILAVVLFVAGFGLLALHSLFSGTFGENVNDLVDLSYSPLRGIGAILSIPAGIVLSVLVVRLKPLAGVMKFVGRHTLPIYLGHYFGLNALGLLFAYGVLTINGESPNLFHWSETWILVGVIFGLVGGYVFHLLSKIPLIGWTITPPSIGGKVTPKKRRLLPRH